MTVLIYSHDHGIIWAYKSCYHGELFDGIASFTVFLKTLTLKYVT